MTALKKLMIDNSFNTWCAYIYLKNCDTNKYGLVKKNLQSQFALGNNQYPKTLSKVTDVLTNHSWDEAWKNADKKKKDVKNTTTSTAKQEEGTLGASLTQKLSGVLTKNGTPIEEITCFRCGKKGHFSTECPETDIAKEDWAIKVEPKGKKTVHWSGVQVGASNFQYGLSLHQYCQKIEPPKLKKADLDNDLLLDSGATMTLQLKKTFLAASFSLFFFLFRSCLPNNYSSPYIFISIFSSLYKNMLFTNKRHKFSIKVGFKQRSCS